MNKAGFTCICDDSKDNVPGASISETENTCCKKQIKELSNNNNLISFSSDFKHYTHSSLTSLSNISISGSDNLQISKYNNLHDRIPPPDIPVTISSLLI